MHADLAVLAGFSLASLGFAGCARERGWGGAVLGVGAGMGFLGKGLFAPAVIGTTALLLPLFFAQWRTRRYALQLLVALVVVLPALIVWPRALYLRSEDLFLEWLNNNLGRFLGYYRPGAVSEKGGWSRALVWFLFPLWVYAAAAIAIERRAGWHQSGMQIGFTLAFIGASVLAISASMRDVYILPLIPPLALAAVAALRRPEHGLERILGSASIVIAAAAALFMWLVWGRLVFEGNIPDGFQPVRYLPATFPMPVSIPALLAAIAFTAAYVALALGRRRLAAPGLSLWVGAIALVWGLAHTLWLPWLDAAKSYRSVFAEIAKHLPPNPDCIVTTSVGESERAMIWYYLGVPPRSRTHRAGECSALLWQFRRHRPHPEPSSDVWRPVWRGGRPADTSEGFVLFVRRERAPFADNPPVR
jgi:4-amino-4-deoxy-L-arabinose transferase-like glycosyltransferase